MKKVIGRHHPPGSCPQPVKATRAHRPTAKPGVGMEVFIAIGVAILGIAAYALWEHSKTIVDLTPAPTAVPIVVDAKPAGKPAKPAPQVTSEVTDSLPEADAGAGK